MVVRISERRVLVIVKLVLTSSLFSSLRDSRAQNLSSEECSLCLLNHLLVHTLRWVIHNHSASLVVDLCVDSRVSDEIYNPFLPFRL